MIAVDAARIGVELTAVGPELHDLAVGPGQAGTGSVLLAAPDRHILQNVPLLQLKEIPTFAEINLALESAGFEVLEGTDRNVGEVPWYVPMEGRYGTWHSALVRVPTGRRVVQEAVRLAEILRIFPRGSAKVVGLMNRTAEAYVSGGKAGIFTPLYCFLARKPA